MPATTPVYALPYQTLADPPNGPTLGSALALAVEAELVRIDAAHTAANNAIMARAADLEAFSVLSARKTADETLTANTTLQDDDHLFVAIPAAAIGGHYFMVLRVAYNASATADIKTGWTVPAGTTIKEISVAFNVTGSLVVPSLTEASVPAFGGGALSGTTDDGLVIVADVIVGGSAGTLKFRWAQNTSSGSTIVRSGSSMTLWRTV